MEEIRTMKHKHLAIELLKKLLTDDIKVRSKQNITLSKKMSERLQAAIQKYQNNLLDSSQIINELIQLGADLRMEDESSAALGLTVEEKAFYDALAANEGAAEVLSNKVLGELAHELVDRVKRDATVDWTVRESARAKLRVTVKRLLRDYGYPPDLEKLAVDRILKQSEQLASDWATAS
jgi:type I restriction enzyme R subunit